MLHLHQLLDPPNNPMNSVLLLLSHFTKVETGSQLPKVTWLVGGEQSDSRTHTSPAHLASLSTLPIQSTHGTAWV